MPNPRWTHDRKLAKEQLGVVGVDEAGRGCLAGPVVAGAVILPTSFFSEASNRKCTEEMNDSKQFDEVKREELYARVVELAQKKKIFTGTGQASVEEIEEHNIVGATCLAMRRAMDVASDASQKIWKPEEKSSFFLFEEKNVPEKKWAILVDGRPMKKLPYEHDGLIKGDTKSLAIAMASMLAKVTRDRYMRELHTKFPDFGFDSNKGYGAPVHLKALDKHGPTMHHRPRFLRNILPDKSAPAKLIEVEQSQLSFL
jgi:ribonuclease HII